MFYWRNVVLEQLQSARIPRELNPNYVFYAPVITTEFPTVPLQSDSGFTLESTIYVQNETCEHTDVLIVQCKISI